MRNSLDVQLSVAIRCDAIGVKGVGHLVRQIALAEELTSRGHQVQFFGDSDVPWAQAQLDSRGWSLLPAPQNFAAAMLEASVDVVMIDGYDFPAELGRSLQAAGIPVATMVDAEFGGQQIADLYIDQNLGAMRPPNSSGEWLVGEQYALLRDVVVRHLDRNPQPPATPPRALVVFGGSDPYLGAPIATRLLLETGQPVEVWTIAASEAAVAELAALPKVAGQTVRVLGRADDLPGLAVQCDFAVSAAGSSVWEFAALGIPTALVAVADNQEVGYQIVAQRFGVGLGRLRQLRDENQQQDFARSALAELITNPSHRAALATQAKQVIDGHGRRRVADALEQLGH